MRKTLLLGLGVILLIPLAPLIDWVYYRDVKPFVPPIRYIGEIPIRNDSYGDGHFGASRSGRRAHKGLDICSPLYSEVIAFRGGRAEIGFDKNGMGKFVIIKHPEDYVTLYGHLSKFSIKQSERIRQGTIIGHVGKTGNAKYKEIEPHLHFEIRKNGRYIDPLLFLK